MKFETEDLGSGRYIQLIMVHFTALLTRLEHASTSELRELSASGFTSLLKSMRSIFITKNMSDYERQVLLHVRSRIAEAANGDSKKSCIILENMFLNGVEDARGWHQELSKLARSTALLASDARSLCIVGQALSLCNDEQADNILLRALDALEVCVTQMNDQGTTDDKKMSLLLELVEGTRSLCVAEEQHWRIGLLDEGHRRQFAGLILAIHQRVFALSPVTPQVSGVISASEMFRMSLCAIKCVPEARIMDIAEQSLSLSIASVQPSVKHRMMKRIGSCLFSVRDVALSMRMLRMSLPLLYSYVNGEHLPGTKNSPSFLDGYLKGLLRVYSGSWSCEQSCEHQEYIHVLAKCCLQSQSLSTSSVMIVTMLRWPEDASLAEKLLEQISKSSRGDAWKFFTSSGVTRSLLYLLHVAHHQSQTEVQQRGISRVDVVIADFLIRGVQSIARNRTPHADSVNAEAVECILGAIRYLQLRNPKVAEVVRMELLSDVQLLVKLVEALQDPVFIPVRVLDLVCSLGLDSEFRRSAVTEVSHAASRIQKHSRSIFTSPPELYHGAVSGEGVEEENEKLSKLTDLTLLLRSITHVIATPKVDPVVFGFFHEILKLGTLPVRKDVRDCIKFFTDCRLSLSVAAGYYHRSSEPRRYAEVLVRAISKVTDFFLEDLSKKSDYAHISQESLIDWFVSTISLGIELALSPPPRMHLDGVHRQLRKCAIVLSQIMVDRDRESSGARLSPVSCNTILGMVGRVFRQSCCLRSSRGGQRKESDAAAMAEARANKIRRCTPYVQMCIDLVLHHEKSLSVTLTEKEVKWMNFALVDSTLMSVIDHQRSIKLLSSTNILKVKPLVRSITERQRSDFIDVIEKQHLAQSVSTATEGEDATPSVASDREALRRPLLSVTRALELSPHFGFTLQQRQRLLAVAELAVSNPASNGLLHPDSYALAEIVAKGEMLYI